MEENQTQHETAYNKVHGLTQARVHMDILKVKLSPSSTLEPAQNYKTRRLCDNLPNNNTSCQLRGDEVAVSLN